MRRHLLPLLLCTCLGPSVAAAAWAQQAAPQSQATPRPEVQAQRLDRMRPAEQAPRRASMSESVRQAQRSSGGRVLGAERMQSDGRDIIRVKVMDGQGRVRYIDNDQQSRRGIDHRGAVPPPSGRDGSSSTP